MTRLNSFLSSLREHLSAGRLGRNLSQYVMQTAVETGCRTVTTFLVAAIFSAALFGRLGVLLTLVHFLYSVADGSSAAIVKFTAEGAARHRRFGAEAGWRGAWLATAGALGGAVAIFTGAALYGGKAGDVPALTLILTGLFGVLWILKISLEAAFRGLKDFGPAAALSIVLTPVYSAVLLAAVWAGWRLQGYMAIMTIGALANAAALAAHYHARHRRGERAGNFDPSFSDVSRELRAHIRAMALYSVPLMLRGAVWFFFLKANILIVAAFHGGAETGYVTLADRFLMLPLLLVGAYVNTVAPRMAEAHALGAHDRMQQYMNKSNTALTAAMAVFGLLFVVLAPALRRWMPDYAAVGPMLFVMAPFLAIKAWGGLAMSGLLIPGGQARLALAIGVFGAALNLLMNLWFVPELGAYGSVLGMIVAHTIVTGVVVYFAKRRMGIAFRFGRLR